MLQIRVQRLGGSSFSRFTAHVTRFLCKWSLSGFWATSGKQTDGLAVWQLTRDVNVASHAPSETPLWLLSQPVVPVPMKRLISFPVLISVTETVVLAQELYIPGNMHETERCFSTLLLHTLQFPLILISYWCTCLVITIGPPLWGLSCLAN